MASYRELLPGDPAPGFTQRSFANPRYVFDSAAGRYLLLCFFGSARDAHAQAAWQAVRSHPQLFDDVSASCFAVSADPADESDNRLADHYPGYRIFWDFDLAAAKLYGAAPIEPAAAGGVPLRPRWVLLTPRLTVLKIIPFRRDRGDIAELLAALDSLPPPFADPYDCQAPVLLLRDIFEADFCRRLIDLYDRDGGTDSGFMRQIDGKTVLVTDPGHKRRKDVILKDAEVIAGTRARVLRRIVPEIKKVHQFDVTRMERYIVACYAAEDGGHFRPHRDNTTAGTAHRRFAVSINLNEEYDGGELRFPEYGERQIKPPAGGAVVFSCSLLHRVTPVTRGRRYAFLPFLYDEAAAKIREANSAFLAEGLGSYRASTPA